VDKQNKKAEARDVVLYLKTAFSNARGEGLWGQGIHAINLYLRSYLDEFDVERACREEYCDTGGMSASGNPYLGDSRKVERLGGNEDTRIGSAPC
jgi:hypothetical protein